MERAFRCSICDKTVRYDGPLPALYPFCSQRCRWVDLGRWLNEQYSIDRDLGPEDGGDDAFPAQSPPYNHWH
jgi:endogenous inhibitor of DNA gyrase (YacG/DUF329 family)